jgi:hypothetical protein
MCVERILTNREEEKRRSIFLKMFQKVLNLSHQGHYIQGLKGHAK